MVAMQDIQAFSEAVAREFEPKRIILFGSYARGDARRDSDVDLLVVLKYRGHPVRKAAEILDRLNPRFAVDLIIRSPVELERRLAQDDWFLQDALEEGEVLYETTDARVG